SSNLSDVQVAFANTWFDGVLPSGLQVGGYTGSGVGLSTGGDAVNLFDTANNRRANVSFGSSPSAAPFGSFDNTEGLDLVTITQLSEIGVNGAFAAANSQNEVGSPGRLARSFNGAYNAWAVDYPEVDLNDTNARVNGNSLSNLMLFAFGLDPELNNSGANLIIEGGVLSQRGEEVLEVLPSPVGTEFAVQFLRRINPEQLGLTYVVQFSHDMESWTSSNAEPVVLATDGEVEAVSVPYPFFTPNGRKARFARIVVILN
ncbi:MAG: hypothetical protein ACQKBV_09495, partial [Puniceicoccales bacterium]